MFDDSILRKWDIRGIYPTQINGDVATRVGYAFAKFIKKYDGNSCIVGRDNRFGGNELASSLIMALTNSGINVTYCNIVTTPMLNYACHKLGIKYGIMITASHNPMDNNGFKIFGDNCLHLDQDKLQEFYDYIKENEQVNASVIGNKKDVDIKNDYINDLVSTINLDHSNQKIVVDCGNGTASTIIRDVYDKIDCDVTYLYCDSDPSFPNHHPDPNVFENLKDLQQKVISENADVGISYDGDADRVGIVDNKGNIVETDKLMAIYAKDILATNTNKNIIMDVKCSMALENAIKNYNGNGIMVCNGSAYIESYVHNYPAVFGGEYSGHVFFNDHHYGFDDGIYAGLRLQEIIKKNNVTCEELSSDYQKLFNTPEIKFATTDEAKFEIVDKVKEYCIEKHYDYLDIDGVRAKFDDGWALVRASNTGPNLTMRFEATTEERVSELKDEFMTLIKNVSK